MKNFMRSKKRGVSEVISILLLLAISLVGAVFVSNIIDNSVFSAVDQNPESEATSTDLKLLSYDTRDSTNLSGIDNLDNKFDQKLCTVSCTSFANNLPTSTNSGTEFIIIHVHNLSTQSVYLRSIQINEVLHTWDSQTLNRNLVLTVDDYSGNYPLAGKFSIISKSNDTPIIQRDSTEIGSDEEVRVLVKLSSNFSSDIEMINSLRVVLNFGQSDAARHVILSGDAR